jgi:hypothetical protein
MATKGERSWSWRKLLLYGAGGIALSTAAAGWYLLAPQTNSQHQEIQEWKRAYPALALQPTDSDMSKLWQFSRDPASKNWTFSAPLYFQLDSCVFEQMDMTTTTNRNGLYMENDQYSEPHGAAVAVQFMANASSAPLPSGRVRFQQSSARSRVTVLADPAAVCLHVASPRDLYALQCCRLLRSTDDAGTASRWIHIMKELGRHHL